MSKPKPEYLITVAAEGYTASYVRDADDLIDAMAKVKKMQEMGVPSVSVRIQNKEYADRLREFFGR